MRIGLISADFAPNIGGVAAHVVELGTALGRAGHDVHIFTLPIGDQKMPTSNWRGMTVHRPAIRKSKPFYTWAMHRFLKDFLKTQPLDVLHVHGMRPLEATRALNVPVLFTNHTSGFLKRLEKGKRAKQRAGKMLTHIAHVLAPSEELVEATRTVGYMGDVDFIPNGVDTNRFQPGPPSERIHLNLREDETVVLLARRLVEKNGVVVFAEAITKMDNPNTRFLFAGDGPEREKVKSILKKGNCLEKAIFLGNVPNDRMAALYRAADISVLPSFMEATSITGLESMATGLPLVGTRVGGIPTLVQHEKTGLLVEPGSPDELATAISKLLENPSLRTKMGQAARERAIHHFSWDHLATATALVYGKHCQPATKKIPIAA